MIMRTVCLKYGGWHYYRYIYLSEPALTHSSIPKSNVRSLWQSNIIFAFRSYICNVLLFPSTSNVDLRCAQCAHCNTLYFLRESCTNRRKVIWHPTIPLVSAFMRGRVGWGRGVVPYEGGTVGTHGCTYWLHARDWLHDC